MGKERHKRQKNRVITCQRNFNEMVAGAITIFTIIFFFIAAAGAVANQIPISPSPIVSASEINYPPFCIVSEDGCAGGFSVELLSAALAVMGRDVVFCTGPWADVKGWLEKGEVQALPLVGRTPEREAFFDFTFPYISLHGAIVVRKDTSHIKNLDDLKGKNVAVMKGDNAEEFLRRKDRGINIHLRLTFEDALKELSNGQHDAVVIQRLLALRLIQKTGIKNLKIVRQSVEGFRQDFCFAVQEGDKDTLALLNEGLALVMADGTYRRLHAKWFAALELPADQHIVIGGDNNYPPYEFIDEHGQPAGYNVELTQAIAREAGMHVEIRLDEWARIRDGLMKGKIDAVHGMFYSIDRDLEFDFSPPHTVINHVAVVRKGAQKPPETLAALSGKRIVVMKKDIMHDFTMKNRLTDFLTAVRTQEDALKELAEGRHDCALVARIPALHWVKKHGWDNLVIGRQSLVSAEYCFAVPHNQKALLAQLSEGLTVVEKTGEYRAIQNKWLGVYEKESIGLSSIVRYTALVATPLLITLLVFFLWSWSLRRRVAMQAGKLAASEKRYRMLSDNAVEAIWATDLNFVFTYINPAIKTITGHSPEEWIGSRLQEHCDQVNFAKITGLIRAELAKGPKGEGVILEAEILKKSRGGVAVEIHGKVIFADDGQPAMFQGIARDVTERKLALQRIKHLNSVLESILDVNELILRERNPENMIRESCKLLVSNRGYTSTLIVLTDSNGRPYSWANAGMKESIEKLNTLLEDGILPPCCQQARRVDAVVQIPDRDENCHNCPIAEACKATHSLCVKLVDEGTILGYLNVSLAGALSVNEEERDLLLRMAGNLAYALSFMQMEKERGRSEKKSKALEAQLIQAQKMESIGRLAGGVAHDYNNTLSVVIGYAEMALAALSPQDPLCENLNEILEAGKRSRDITKQLLAFARQQTIAPVVLDLNSIVKKTLKMLRLLIGEDIELVWQPVKQVWPVKIDPSQINQILTNLCVNARDAIRDIGKITIETQNVKFDVDYCSSHQGFIPGEFVMLAVSDDGKGMSPETQHKAFEPFFTTKSLGKGTGLGLSTVYGIVKQNNGFINLYSELDKGTIVKVYFARHCGQATPMSPKEIADIPFSQGETVLLVEDDHSILTLGKRILETLEYTVLPAKTPSEAIKLADKHALKINLLVTDVIMPEMNGRELSEQLQKTCPGLKTLFMSGYTANVIAHHSVLREGVTFLQKPFSRRDMALKVREALNNTKE